MPVDRSNLKVRAFLRRWKRQGEDLCDLLAPLKTDQGAGHTISDTAVAVNLPCVYKQIARNAAQVTISGVTAITTHEIEMEAATATLAMDRHYKIKVHARGNNPQLFFEHPVKRQEPFMPVITVQAVHKAGYIAPAMT